MAALTIQSANEAGLIISYSPADVAGDTFVNDGNTRLLVKNGGGGSLDVTITAQKTTTSLSGYGILTKQNQVLSVGAGAEAVIGPFPSTAFNNASGSVAVTYSGVTSLEVAAVKG